PLRPDARARRVQPRLPRSGRAALAAAGAAGGPAAASGAGGGAAAAQLEAGPGDLAPALDAHQPGGRAGAHDGEHAAREAPAARAGLAQSAHASTAEASAWSSPLSEKIAEAPSSVWPSAANGQPITIQRAPTGKGRIRWAVSWLSETLRRPKASSSAKPVGQSSAAQTNSGRTVPCLSNRVGSGAHGAATRRRPGMGPG